MTYFIKFKNTDLNAILKSRNNEIKIGERLLYTQENQDIESFIATTEANYIVLGINEDYGVMANSGVRGTSSAWNIFIQNFVNVQNNGFLKGKNIAVLGHFNFDSLLNIPSNFNLKNADNLQLLYKTVSEIDKEISYLISIIIKAKKIPIIIGGGHNNAYGNIKGLSLAKSKAVNVVNFDAHTDFRNLEGRHSGNGFSYAYEHGFLKKYFVFGVHENYLSKSILKNIDATNGNVIFNTYEEVMIREEKNFSNELKNALLHIEKDSFGVEIDMDSIINMPSSAQTPSGYSMEKVRQFTNYFGASKKSAYLHICEAAPSLAPAGQENQIGKAITYIVTDFIKAKQKIANK